MWRRLGFENIAEVVCRFYKYTEQLVISNDRDLVILNAIIYPVRALHITGKASYTVGIHPNNIIFYSKTI